MKYIAALVLVLLASTSYSQTKYLVDIVDTVQVRQNCDCEQYKEMIFFDYFKIKVKKWDLPLSIEIAQEYPDNRTILDLEYKGDTTIVITIDSLGLITY